MTSSIAIFSAVPVYAGTSIDQETLYPILKTSSQEYLYPVIGNSNTIYRYTTIPDVLSQFAEQSTLNQKSIYTLMNSIGGYVDGIEGYVDNLETLVTTTNTHLNAINGYVDGIEGKIDTSNTRLNDIKSAIQNITTYNYTQVLSDILTNTGYLSTIDTYTQSIQDSIGYGTTGDNVLSKLSSLVLSNSQINDNVNDLKSNFDYTPVTFNVLTREYNYSSPNVYSVNGIPFLSRDFSGTYDINYINGNKTTTNGLLDIINKNIFMSANSISTPRSYYYNDIYDPSTNANTRYPAYSLMDVLTLQFNNIGKDIKKLTYVIADDDTISAKKANQSQEQAVLTNFTGQGSASASVSDFGQLSNAVGSVKSGLNTNASPADVLTVFNSNDGFGWFSQTTLNELDTTTQSTRRIKAGSDTPLYDSNYNAIMAYLTGGDRK